VSVTCQSPPTRTSAVQHPHAITRQLAFTWIPRFIKSVLLYRCAQPQHLPNNSQDQSKASCPASCIFFTDHASLGESHRASTGAEPLSAHHETSMQYQGSQAPLGDFGELVEGPWPSSTSCPPGALWWRASAFKAPSWGENGSKHPPFWVQTIDQLVADPATTAEISGLLPMDFDPLTSLRALRTLSIPHLHCMLCTTRW
jgi:hypothetical protein